jgi:hypothetical protein|tara:strand:+ start:207 stop:488 length:282 start_codon:yes stop_codon:yes gene_type:complete
MNQETHTICPEINGVRHLSDLEVFQCFNVEVGKQGHDLWGYRVKQDRKIGERDVPKHDNLPHSPGTTERVEWLRSYYENQTGEESPFEENGEN